MKLKTLIIDTTLVLGLVIGVGPWFVGKTVHNMIVSQVDTVNKMYAKVGDTSRFILKDYQRGWFTSTAVFEWKMENLNSQEVALDLVLNETLFHGPIIWSRDTKLPHFALAKIASHITANKTDIIQLDQTEFDTTVWINYAAVCKMDFGIEKLSGKFRNQTPFELKALAFNGSSNLRSDYESEGRINFKEGVFQSPVKMAKAVKVTDAHLETNDNGLRNADELMGNSKVNLGTVTITAKNNEEIIFKDLATDLNFNLQTKRENPVSELLVKISYKDLIVEKINVGSGQIDFELNNFDFAKLAQKTDDETEFAKLKTIQEQINYVFGFRVNSNQPLNLAINKLQFQTPAGELFFDGDWILNAKNATAPATFQAKASLVMPKNFIELLTHSGVLKNFDNFFPAFNLLKDMMFVEVGDQYRAYFIMRDEVPFLNGIYMDRLPAAMKSEMMAWQNPLSKENEMLLAIWKDDANKVKEFLAQGINANFVVGKSLRPIFVASHLGNLEIVNALFEKNIPLDQKDAEGNTALMWAIKGSHTDVIDLLLKKGIPVDTANLKGVSPLQQAAFSGSKETVELLLNANASVNNADNEGSTALHRAAEAGRADIVSLLLTKGADPLLVNLGGKTARTIAAETRHPDVMNLLGVEPAKDKPLVKPIKNANKAKK